MKERSLLKIFIGDKEKAIHKVLEGYYSAPASSRFLGVWFEAKDDQPDFNGKITKVAIETTGDISREETLLVMHGLTQTMKGRVGQAAEFYLQNMHVPGPEQLKKGFKTLGNNNLEAITQACKAIKNRSD